jgi:hypothetical protein
LSSHRASSRDLGSTEERNASDEAGVDGPGSASIESDPVIEAYKKHIDRTLLRQSLRRSVSERLANLIALQQLAAEARRAGHRSRPAR